uniref:Uncharacterized protein n=1 Tax=Romanomermis culicivorax TaxID=13658 RepID=A0A915J1V0_ROMCU
MCIRKNQLCQRKIGKIDGRSVFFDDFLTFMRRDIGVNRRMCIATSYNNWKKTFEKISSSIFDYKNFEINKPEAYCQLNGENPRLDIIDLELLLLVKLFNFDRNFSMKYSSFAAASTNVLLLIFALAQADNAGNASK